MRLVLARSAWACCLAWVMGLGAVDARAAVHQFAAFNPSPSQVGNSFLNFWRSENLGSAPAANYVGFQILVDWTGGNFPSFDQTSKHAKIHLSDVIASGSAQVGPLFPGYTGLQRFADNGSDNTYDVLPLRFRGGLATPYNGGADLHFHYGQFTVLGSNANWANVRVSLATTISEALSTIPVTLVNGVNTFTKTYSRFDNTLWYEFTLSSPVNGSNGQAMTIDTIGNTLLGGAWGNFDTDMALYNASGSVVATNGGFFNPAFSRSSMIIAGLPAASVHSSATGFGNAGMTLPAGTYYLAVAPAALNASANFNVGADVELNRPLIFGDPLREIIGDFRVNITFTQIPEPGTLGMLSVGCLAIGWRRR